MHTHRTMAGPTVASRATKTVLARLGRKNHHRDASGPSDGSAKPSPLTAVWAIVQAYAIVALVLTVYNSVFISDNTVPDTVTDQHNYFTFVKNALFGDGVLADVYNLDRFLGVSSTSHHLTRMACRRSLDAVAGTGWVAQQATYYAIDTTTPMAKDALEFTTTELQLDVAWASIAKSAAFTWKNMVNVAFLSWTIVKPAVVFVLPFWDFVWDGVEPIVIGAKDSVVDSAEDAYFAFEESVGEELGPTFRQWGKSLKPFVMFPVNVYRFFVATVIRPAVYFCTYPELHGDLEIPERPVIERLRWGEKCRKTKWSDWGNCSSTCGAGYRARINHCGTKEVVRCDGPGEMGCDEVCNSGATMDCSGRCLGQNVVDCKGVCGGTNAFGCDGRCTDPPAAKDDNGKCCVSPTFVLQTTGLCNTTADPQTEMLAEAARLKRKLQDAKAKMAAGYVPGRRGKSFKSHQKAYSALEALASEVAIADSNAGLTPQADYLRDLEDAQLKAEEDAELAAAKKELAEKLRQRELLLRKVKLAAERKANQRSWRKAIMMAPYDVTAALLKFTFSRYGALTLSVGAFVAVLSAAVSYSFKKLERDLNKGADEDDDDASVVSVGSKAKKVFEQVAAHVAELKKKLKKPEPEKAPEKQRKYAESGKSAVAGVSAKIAAKLSGQTGVVSGGTRRAAATSVKKNTAVASKPELPDTRADLFRAKRRCVVSLVNMSVDSRLDWRIRLRCHAALLRLAVKGDGKPWLIVSLGAVGSATAAMEEWVARKTAGDGQPMLQPGPDAALQLLRVLASQQNVNVVKALRKQHVVESGTAAHTLLDVLAETPGVLQVQHAGLATLWEILKLGAKQQVQLERRLIDRGLFEHCQDEWEDSKEDRGVAHGIGGVVMQLAMGGGEDVKNHLSKSGAQGLVTKVFEKHPTLSYKGAFSGLKTWLRQKP